jgi:6-phosphogluconate dehydrogenase
MVERTQVIEDCRHALCAAKLLSYAQGFNLIKAASDSQAWSIDLAQCAKIWQKGCVIRALLLQRIHTALKSNPEISNLVTAREFAEDLAHQQQSLRRVVTLAVACGIPVPALSASIAYYDQIRSSRLSANLIQAQRDFFGGHTFERIDRPVGSNFHYLWTEGHKDIGNLGERKAAGGGDAHRANY